jgi:hypothetical protein
MKVLSKVVTWLVPEDREASLNLTNNGMVGVHEDVDGDGISIPSFS